jgi:hypothetical protein
MIRVVKNCQLTIGLGQGLASSRARGAGPLVSARQPQSPASLENGFFLWDTKAFETRSSSKSVIESDRVEGTAVYDPQDNHIGTIKRLIIEKVSGRVLYVDITFGGFLGLGTHHHTIPWEKLAYEPSLGGYRTDVTEEQVRGAPPTYGDAEVWPERSREKEMREYWRIPPNIGVS